MDIFNVSNVAIPDMSSRIMDIMNALQVDRAGNSMITKLPIPQTLPQKIPTTVEELMALEGLSDWPEHTTAEYPLQHEPKHVLGDEEEIRALLKEAAPLEEQLAILEALEHRASRIEESLKRYGDCILTADQRVSKIKNGTFFSNVDKLFMTEITADGHKAQASGKLKGQVVDSIKDKKRKDVNFTEFPGFRPKELTELPGQLETPQLLHRITKAQMFNHSKDLAGFAKFWKKIFLSEASVAIVQDLFWWTFLKIFKPSTQIQQDQLFDRLADSFAALFFSVHSDIRDKIFKVYPEVLSQAIFIIFYEAFPESHRMFGPMFKEELVGYCWELVTGTKPVPGTWASWDLERLLPRKHEDKDITASNLEARIGVQQSYDFEALWKTIDNLDRVTEQGGEILLAEEPAKPKLKTRKKKESVLIGPGAEYEKVMFSLGGLSPLIAHFLNMKHLRDFDNGGRKVRRTEIKGQPTGDKTYRDVIAERKRLAKANKDNFEKLCNQTEEEIQRIEWKKSVAVREIEKLKRNIHAFKNTGQDIKFIADRLISKALEKESHKPLQLVNSAGEIDTGRDTASEISDHSQEEIINAEVSTINDYENTSHTLGGERVVNVSTYTKDKNIAARRKELAARHLQKDVTAEKGVLEPDPFVD